MNLSNIILHFYNQNYSKPWESGPINDSRVRKILSLSGSNKRILDVGCYDGTIAKELEKNYNHVIGLDIAENAVKMARKKGIEAYQLNTELESFPKSLGKFDVVIAGELMEHLFNPDIFLEKVWHILWPKGHLVLTTPNLAGLGSRLCLLLGNSPWMIENDILPGKSGHIRYFTPSSLKDLIHRHGFKVIECTTDSVGLYQMTLPLMDKVLPNLGRIIIIKAQKI